jgi:thioredoxin
MADREPKTTGAPRLALALIAAALLGAVPACREIAPVSGPHKPVENLTYVTSVEEFEQVVLQAPTPVLVDLYTDWCPPCRRLAPVLARLAPKYKGRVAFAKVNVDKVGKLAQRYSVRAVPTLLIVRDGKEVKRIEGAPPERRLRAELDAVAN